MALHVVDDGLAAHGKDALGRAQHRTPQILVGKGGFLEVVEDDIVGGIVGVADLLDDDGQLAGQLVGVHDRVLQDIGDDVGSQADVVFQDLGIVGRVFVRGVGVEVPAHRFDLLGNGARRAPFGPLEGHVFQDMGNAVDLGRLVARTDADPGAQRHRFNTRHGVAGNAQPVVERGNANAFVSRHEAVPPARRWVTKSCTTPRSLGRVSKRSGRS